MLSFLLAYWCCLLGPSLMSMVSEKVEPVTSTVPQAIVLIDLGRSFLLEGVAKINCKVLHFSFNVIASLVHCPKTLPLVPLSKFISKVLVGLHIILPLTRNVFFPLLFLTVSKIMVQKV
jgi:hypothetical protein